MYVCNLASGERERLTHCRSDMSRSGQCSLSLIGACAIRFKELSNGHTFCYHRLSPPHCSILQSRWTPPGALACKPVITIGRLRHHSFTRINFPCRSLANAGTNTPPSPTQASSSVTTDPATTASLTKSKSMGCSHRHVRGVVPCFLTPSSQKPKIGRPTMYAVMCCLRTWMQYPIVSNPTSSNAKADAGYVHIPNWESFLGLFTRAIQ